MKLTIIGKQIFNLELLMYAKQNDQGGVALFFSGDPDPAGGAYVLGGKSAEAMWKHLILLGVTLNAGQPEAVEAAA